MKRNLLVLAMIVILGSLASSSGAWVSPAWKDCEQQDLAGTWDVEIWGGATDGVNCWDTCSLTLDSAGEIQAGSVYVECTGPMFNVTGGQLTLYSGCIVKGTIVTTNGTLEVGPGGITGEGRIVLGTNR